MARIRTYDNDATISDQDRIIGTDSTNNSTKNFTIGALGDHILSGEVLSEDQVPENRYPVIGDNAVLRQGLLSERATSEDDVSIPTSTDFRFTLSRDGIGFVISIVGYGTEEHFPYDVQSFIGKNWVADDYATEANQTITAFLEPAFSVSSTGAVTWRFRTTLTTPASQDEGAGTIGRALTNVVISSLDRRDLVISGGVTEAVNDSAAATAGVPVDGIYSNAGALRIRRA